MRHSWFFLHMLENIYMFQMKPFIYLIDWFWWGSPIGCNDLALNFVLSQNWHKKFISFSINLNESFEFVLFIAQR